MPPGLGDTEVLQNPWFLPSRPGECLIETSPADAAATFDTDLRSEEPEVREELGDSVNDVVGGLDCFRGLLGAGLFGRVKGILELVAPAAQTAEGPSSAQIKLARNFADAVSDPGGAGRGQYLGQVLGT